MEVLRREILLSFGKIHIHHHAAHGPIYGMWMLDELDEHGYKLSPGTLYPIFRRMEKNGWLVSKEETVSGKRRKNYRITRQGEQVLDILRRSIKELHREVVTNRPRMVD